MRCRCFSIEGGIWMMIRKRLIQKSYKLLRDTKPRGWSRRAEAIEGYDADEFHQRFLVPKKKAHRQSICSILKKRATDMGKISRARQKSRGHLRRQRGGIGSCYNMPMPDAEESKNKKQS